MLGVFPRVFGQRGAGLGDEPTNSALGAIPVPLAKP